MDNNVPNFEISWPRADFISLETKSSAFVTGFLYSLDIKTGNLEKILEAPGLSAVWKKDGSGILYSGPDLSLKLEDIKSGAVKDLGVKTIAEKCAFANQNKNLVYCALPKNIPAGQFPDDWWQGKVFFDDNIVSINLDTLDKSVIAAANADAIKPLLLQNDSYLLFQNKNTGSLWSLKLK